MVRLVLGRDIGGEILSDDDVCIGFRFLRIDEAAAVHASLTLIDLSDEPATRRLLAAVTLIALDGAPGTRPELVVQVREAQSRRLLARYLSNRLDIGRSVCFGRQI